MKISLYLNVFLFSLVCLFGYLSYSFYSDKALVESQLEVALVSNGFLNVSLKRKNKVCSLQDKIAAENQTEQLQLVKEKDTVLHAIDKMVSSSRVKQNVAKGTENVHETSNVVSLDGVLPSTLVSLLNENCNSSKGSACIQP
jgi:hypothetical protein